MSNFVDYVKIHCKSRSRWRWFRTSAEKYIPKGSDGGDGGRGGHVIMKVMQRMDLVPAFYTRHVKAERGEKKAKPINRCFRSRCLHQRSYWYYCKNEDGEG